MTSLRAVVAVAFATAFAGPPAQAAEKYTPLYSFAGNPDGAAPFGPLVQGTGQTFYGSTYQGGTGTCPGGFLPGCGTLYSVTLKGGDGTWSASETVLYDFQGGDDGYYPEGALVAGPGGVFYGVTTQGGQYQNGTVFSLARHAGTWVKTTLWSFNGADGGQPSGALLLGSDGALYGTGRGGQYGQGVVFQLIPPTKPGGSWTESPIYAFMAGAGDQFVASPTALIGDPATGFYGTTQYGGTGPCTVYNGGNPPIPSGCGTVYTLVQTSPAVWTQNVIYNFQGSPHDGKNAGGLVMGAGGTLYGTTYDGGGGPTKYCPFGCGLVYALAPAGGGWSETVLKAFAQPNAGFANPTGLLVLSASQLLVTTAPRDGDAFSTVLGLAPGGSGGSWKTTWSIGDVLGHGETQPFLTPFGNLLVGVAAYGGNRNGSVFLLAP